MNLKLLSATELRLFGTDLQKHSYINNCLGIEVGKGSSYSCWRNGQDCWLSRVEEELA